MFALMRGSMWIFLLASLILAVTPGPGVLFIIARTASHGLRAGLVSVAAIAVGNFGSAVGAALGLAVIFKLSTAAFSVVKFAGACYLIYLAIAALRARRANGAATEASPVGLSSVFKDGLLVALLNPKTALFFAAFLPQFVSSGGNSAKECIALGAIFVLVAASTDSIYAVLTAATRARVARLNINTHAGSYAAAGVYASLGLYAALSGASGAR